MKCQFLTIGIGIQDGYRKGLRKNVLSKKLHVLPTIEATVTNKNKGIVLAARSCDRKSNYFRTWYYALRRYMWEYEAVVEIGTIHGHVTNTQRRKSCEKRADIPRELLLTINELCKRAIDAFHDKTNETSRRMIVVIDMLTSV